MIAFDALMPRGRLTMLCHEQPLNKDAVFICAFGAIAGRGCHGRCRSRGMESGATKSGAGY